jgi:hypothetical protein
MYYRSYDTMDLRGFLRRLRCCTTSTAKVAEAVRPGMLIEFTRSGLILPHSEFEGLNERAFVLPQVLSTDEREVFEAGELAPYIKATGKSGVFVLLKGGQRVEAGTHLVSAGDGTVISEHSGSGHAKAYAARSMEDVDLTNLGDRIIAAHTLPKHGENYWKSIPELIPPHAR